MLTSRMLAHENGLYALTNGLTFAEWQELTSLENKQIVPCQHHIVVFNKLMALKREITVDEYKQIRDKFNSQLENIFNNFFNDVEETIEQ